MLISENENLAKYTTINIGGIAQRFYIPENEEDIKQIKAEAGNEHIYILSGGSNLLINDRKLYKYVMYMAKADERIIDKGNGLFYCGASVRVQTFIRYAAERGYGGAEYLFPIPALMGGIITMNAGTGRKKGKAIQDFIQTVHVLQDGVKTELIKDDCKFGYRSSVFLGTDDIIIGADILLQENKKEEITKIISDEINWRKEKQDTAHSNFGSVFSKNNRYIMALLKKCGIGFHKGVAFSDKTSNWLINKGQGTYKQAYFLICLCKLLHFITLQKIKTEVIIWR